jgi:hypothetical protein
MDNRDQQVCAEGLTKFLKGRKEFVVRRGKKGRMEVRLSPVVGVNLLLETPVVDDSEGDKILNDPVIIKECSEEAEAVFGILRGWSGSERVENAKRANEEFKEANKEVAVVQSRQKYWELAADGKVPPGAVEFPLSADDDQDGEEINAEVPRMSFDAQVADNGMRLTNMQFLLLAGVVGWKDGKGKGEALIDSDPEAAVKFAASLLLYRRAKLFKEYNGEFLPEIRGFKIEFYLGELSTIKSK